MNQRQPSELNADVYINLHRPLIFFDLETTGTNAQTDRIVEISAIKLNPDHSQERLYHILNPGIPIAESATLIHGFTDKDVEDKPAFCDVADEVCSFFTGCDLAGYNVRRFDIPMLMEEFHRCKQYPILLTETKVVDVMSIYHKKEPRDLSAAVRFYCGEEVSNAHSAQADVEATMKVFQSQLQRYDDLQPSVHHLHSFCDGSEDKFDASGKLERNEEGRIIFTFGKYKNQLVDFDNKDILEYISWMKEPGRFSVITLMALSRAKAHHKCHKMCMEWLQSKDLLASAENLKALQQALTLEKDVYPFSVSRDGKKLTVLFHHRQEPALLLCSEDDKLIALFILQHSLKNAHPLQSVRNMAAAEELA